MGDQLRQNSRREISSGRRVGKISVQAEQSRKEITSGNGEDCGALCSSRREDETLVLRKMDYKGDKLLLTN